MLIAALAVSATLPTLAAAARILPDVKGHWAEEPIQALIDKDIINGYPDGLFHPEDPITRAQYLKLLIAAEEGEVVKGLAPSFTDTADQWVHLQGYLETAVKWGVIIPSEFPGGRFEPDRTITREEMAVWTVRCAYLTLPGLVPAKGAVNFKDAADINPGAAKYVAEAVKREIIKGLDDRTFRPKDGATRAQAAAVVFRRLGAAPNIGCFQHH